MRAGDMFGCGVAILMILCSVSLSAQELDEYGNLMATSAADPYPPVGAVPDADPDWGTSSTTLYRVGSSSFVPTTETVTWEENAFWRWTETPGLTFWSASIDLPSGAIIDFISAEIDDTSGVDIAFWLATCANLSSSCVFTPTVTSSGTPGKTIIGGGTGSPIIVNNFLATYHFRFRLASGGGSHKFRSANLLYRLQVSPEPGTATFTDVPTGHPFFQYVEALADSGITAGCGGGNFCPDAPLTRGQMAVFLAKALGLHWQ